MPNATNLVIFPNEEIAEGYKDDPRFENFEVKLLSSGVSAVQGIRFHHLFVYWQSYHYPNYTDFMDTLRLSWDLSNKQGELLFFV